MSIKVCTVVGIVNLNTKHLLYLTLISVLQIYKIDPPALLTPVLRSAGRKDRHFEMDKIHQRTQHLYSICKINL